MKWQSASSILIMALTMFDSYALMRFPIIRTLVFPLKAQATTFNIHEFLMNSTIPREESLTILQYIHNQDLLLKEKDLAMNNKDLQHITALKDKDLAINNKDLQHVIALKDKDLAMKDKDLEISVVHERLTSVNRELLMSRGACTARGIFEYYLKSVHQEMMIKGSFNAKKVCTLIGKTSIYPCS
jgi:hypothetical protein